MKVSSVVKLIISDTNLDIQENNNLCIIQNNGKINPCVGCFECWIRPEGKCIIDDGYNDLAEKLSQCDELLILSECRYGEFSPFIKRVYDRSISYVKPNFTIRHGKMHHKRKFGNIMKIKAFLYGDNLTIQEKETMDEMVNANANNYEAIVDAIFFYNSKNEASEALHEHCNH